ncbi:PASTA domain-containing protein [Egicoccus sp. AB-alg6-2]|uniref:PASTA domain-containing protein n=1 Tax=Egicoccus sp. AB-alg6-2 TaxID=3242692 RepID=UPI00359D640C
MRTTTKAGWAGVLGAAVLLAGCGGGDTGTTAPEEEAPAGSTTDEAAEEAEEASRMPDMIGRPVDEAVAELEELGFVVSTGLVRTTEMEPDLVYRSEPAPGRQVTEGQRVTLRVAAEPRQ